MPTNAFLADDRQVDVRGALAAFELVQLRTNPVFGNEAVVVEVWVNPQGYVPRFAGTLEDVSCTVSLGNFGAPINVLVPSQDQMGGIGSTSGQQLFADGAGTLDVPG